MQSEAVDTDTRQWFEIDGFAAEIEDVALLSITASRVMIIVFVPRKAAVNGNLMRVSEFRLRGWGVLSAHKNLKRDGTVAVIAGPWFAPDSKVEMLVNAQDMVVLLRELGVVPD